MHFNRIVPGSIKSLLANERPLIRSTGLFIRDYIYIKDVSDAYRTLAEQMDNPAVVGQAFNFSTDVPLTTIEIVEKIRRLMGKSHLEPHYSQSGLQRNSSTASLLCKGKAASWLASQIRC